MSRNRRETWLQKALQSSEAHWPIIRLEVPKCETFAVKAVRVPQIGCSKTAEKVECLAESHKTMKSLMVLVLIFWAQWGWSYTVSGTTYTTNGSQSDGRPPFGG